MSWANENFVVVAQVATPLLRVFKIMKEGRFIKLSEVRKIELKGNVYESLTFMDDLEESFMVGAGYELALFQNGLKKTELTLPCGTGQEISSIYASSRSRILMGTFDGRLYRYEMDTKRLVLHAQFSAVLSICQIAEIGRGFVLRLWTHQGYPLIYWDDYQSEQVLIAQNSSYFGLYDRKFVVYSDWDSGKVRIWKPARTSMRPFQLF